MLRVHVENIHNHLITSGKHSLCLLKFFVYVFQTCLLVDDLLADGLLVDDLLPNLTEFLIFE